MKVKPMKVLVACEESQVVTTAFRVKGHEAYSCDTQDYSGGHPEWHLKNSVLDVLDGDWDLMIAHPPCTYLANSGVRWLTDNPERYEDMIEACSFFNLLLDAPIPLIAVENPIQHKHARKYIRKPDQIVQPWWFGDGETKATCLWLKGLPPLMATVVHTGRVGRIWREPPSPERSKNRSKTYQGLANAMAEQWGNRDRGDR
jgi:hypothetical protein